MTPRRLSQLVVLTAGLYFVDMFLRWVPRHRGPLFGPGKLTGWEVQLGLTAATLALAAAFVEAARLAGIWRSYAASLLAAMLSLGAGIFALGAMVHLRWGGYVALRFGYWAYGAWIALVLAVALLVLAVLRIDEHRRFLRFRR